MAERRGALRERPGVRAGHGRRHADGGRSPAPSSVSACVPTPAPRPAPHPRSVVSTAGAIRRRASCRGTPLINSWSYGVSACRTAADRRHHRTLGQGAPGGATAHPSAAPHRGVPGDRVRPIVRTPGKQPPDLLRERVREPQILRGPPPRVPGPAPPPRLRVRQAPLLGPARAPPPRRARPAARTGPAAGSNRTTTADSALPSRDLPAQRRVPPRAETPDARGRHSRDTEASPPPAPATSRGPPRHSAQCRRLTGWTTRSPVRGGESGGLRRVPDSRRRAGIPRPSRRPSKRPDPERHPPRPPPPRSLLLVTHGHPSSWAVCDWNRSPGTGSATSSPNACST